MSSHFGMYVDPTQKGIPQGSSAEEVAAFRTEEVDKDKDSELDENVEIVEMEKRDFDDVEGIESDVK
jgi:hypothetical protein